MLQQSPNLAMLFKLVKDGFTGVIDACFDGVGDTDEGPK
jgi:hypothetical protein